MSDCILRRGTDVQALHMERLQLLGGKTQEAKFLLVSRVLSGTSEQGIMPSLIAS